MTDTIQLIDAARFTDRDRPEPHQVKAWQSLQSRLTAAQLEEFAAAFRDGPPPPAPVPACVGLALPVIREFERCRLEAYPDPETGGEPWTIGWGNTQHFDGTLVRPGDTITQAVADQMLDSYVRDFARSQLAKRIPGWARLTAGQQAALLSFSYNAGVAFYGAARYQTITACLRDSRLDDVPAALRLYVNPGGPSEAGLRRRREAEIRLWGGGPARPAGKVLTVPYFSQLDNTSGAGYRECFSSSCAMVAAFHGKVAGDDDYNLIRARFGDSTDAQAQLAALRSLGLDARFVTNAAVGLLEAEILAGRPVAVGWLHKGPVTAPTGGGHWTVAVGFTADAIVHNDPNGEANMPNGGYVNHTGGAGVRYSRKNWLRRWEADGPGTGWAVLVRKA
jgi:GH24 family phage-related lysozyme (muramidase)